VIKSRGFTLLEVLVALAVFATSAAALIYSLGESTRAQAYMEHKTLAHWIAMNQLSLTRLQAKWPGIGSTSGTEEMTGTEWHWTRIVEQTADAKLRRVNMEVRLNPEDETPLIRLAAFVSQEPIKLSTPSAGTKDENDPNPTQVPE
jgi:general secretion pathway protein I